MRTLLLTAFEPFGGERVNPSWETAASLNGEIIADVCVKTRCLPVVFGKSLVLLEQYLADIKPDIVICLGQAGGRVGITPERVAINLNDARIPDNEGNQPCDVPIFENAPAAYFSTLPVKAMVQALIEQGIPASVSYTAGTFVCNHIFYGVQHLATRYAVAQSGFVHLPYFPEQAANLPNQPSMARETQLQALRLMIMVVAKNCSDIIAVGGETH